MAVKFSYNKWLNHIYRIKNTLGVKFEQLGENEKI